MVSDYVLSSLGRRPLTDTKPHILKVAHTAINHIPPRSLFVHNLRPKSPKELQRRLVQLHISNLPAQAHPGAIPKRHVILEELLRPLRVLKPPLGPELTRIIPIQLLVAVHEPRVARELHPLGDEPVLAEVHAAGARDAGEDVGRRGRQAHRLAQAGEVVWAVGHDVLVLRDAAPGADPAGLGRGVQLGHQLGVDVWVGEDVHHHCLEGCAGRVCAGEEHEEDLGFDVV